MISQSPLPKQYKREAALPGQTQVTPLRQVVEAAVEKTAPDGQPRVLYLKSTAPSSDRTAQPYITTKFDSRHEDAQLRTPQPRKLKRIQHQGATEQLKCLTKPLLDLPSAPSTATAQQAAQDLDKLLRTSDGIQLFGLPCTPELLEQLKRMESAQLAQRSTESTPRQPPVRTPRSNADRPQPQQTTDGEESSTASQTTVSRSEESTPPPTVDTPRKAEKVRKKKIRRQDRELIKRPDRRNLAPIRKAYVDQQREMRERQEQSLFDLQDLMFPETPIHSPRTQPGTPTRPPQLPPSTSAPLIPALAPTRQLPPLPVVGQGEPSGTESSGEPSPPAAQSDRPKSTVESIPMDSLQISKSQSTPTSPTPPDQIPPISPRGLKPQPVPKFHRPSKLVIPQTPQATPRSPSKNPASPITETKPETPISEQ